MRFFCAFVVLFSYLNADELLNTLILSNKNENIWNHFDFNAIKSPPQVKKDGIDFKNVLNQSLAEIFERYNGIDQTEGNLDFQNESIQIKNLNSIYEGKDISILFQKELYGNKNAYNYSAGLINRYEKNDFLLGFSGFIDKQVEKKDNASLGLEFGYSSFFRAYIMNYYVLNELQDEENSQIMMSFLMSEYSYFTLGVSRDNEKTNYQISYSPYSIFNLKLIHRNFITTKDEDTIIQLGFSFNFNDSLFKQLKKKNNILQEVNRHSFLQKSSVN